jgi:hypothetical protein
MASQWSNNQAAVIAELLTNIAQAETLDANWGTLNAAQKDTVARQSIRATAKLARLVLHQLDSA